MENLGQTENQENGAGSQPDHEVKVNEGFFSQIISSIQFWKKSDHRFSRAPTDEHPVRQASPSPSIPLPEIEAPNSESGEQKPESSRFGKQCLKIFKVFVNAFGLIFLAEWGDRSQLATIVLASVNDVAGVILGGVLGHTLCTGLAVLAGALVN
jgi:putative Ca2+/H+ antiporter (TMEM165/GDT1 family)